MEVHLYYTLPILGLLFGLLRPFHSQQDTFKYVFLCTMAFSTASIWDNYIVYHRAWWYCPSCVTAVIGYVPLEEYMFFIIMSLMTVAFTNLVMRWYLPSIFIKPDTPMFKSLLVRYLPIVGFLSVGVHAWVNISFLFLWIADHFSFIYVFFFPFHFLATLHSISN